ncbi:hypothetical protein ACFPRL_18800 [Pseudoclavibacter helvolus]
MRTPRTARFDSAAVSEGLPCSCASLAIRSPSRRRSSMVATTSLPRSARSRTKFASRSKVPSQVRAASLSRVSIRLPASTAVRASAPSRAPGELAAVASISAVYTARPARSTTSTLSTCPSAMTRSSDLGICSAAASWNA